MKSVLITGASRGLGRELLYLYQTAGWITLPLVRNQHDADTILATAFAKYCHPIVGDICYQEIESIITAKLGNDMALDLLINNAGVPGRSYGLLDTCADEVAELFSVHTLGTLRVCRAALPALLKSGAGRIVNISSRLGSIEKSARGEFSNQGFSYSYRIAKAAQNMLSACMAEELIPQGIGVSVIHPGRFHGGAAASDATMSARQAALRIQRWIDATQGEVSIEYVEPEVGVFQW
ncbi:SDR family NAD(P)-dependent oxidoreductase [Methylobacillus arboreus]|uniref:SDR family NAD(P)-dependent oxidoreductase n=1 Tax=Methylobacillus arboreus TaxID=755170 RepID=UPI001E4043B5|nr:SDR family NAD(P)-dependent oxidoreductase [Methylobacillus arboreus]MCB5190177.1 SDR family NAD(P)-dependent oxidoreductase [Methylobacillus arboreus]